MGLGFPKGIALRPQHATGAALLVLRGLGFLSQRNSSALCTWLPAPWLQNALNCLSRLLPVVAPVVASCVHPSFSMGLPSGAMGSPSAAPAPRRVQTARAHLGGAKNNPSGGKAWKKEPPPRHMRKMGSLCSAPLLPLLRAGLYSRWQQLSPYGRLPKACSIRTCLYTKSQAPSDAS